MNVLRVVSGGHGEALSGKFGTMLARAELTGGALHCFVQS